MFVNVKTLYPNCYTHYDVLKLLPIKHDFITDRDEVIIKYDFEYGMTVFYSSKTLNETRPLFCFSEQDHIDSKDFYAMYKEAFKAQFAEYLI